MSHLPKVPEWAEGVYQLERNDPVSGGPLRIDEKGKERGTANKPLIDLANRTEWLKEKYDTAFDNLGWMQLGLWAVGLEVSLPTQIVSFDGSWYRYRGNLDVPHVIVGGSPEEDGGIWSGDDPDGVWVDVGEVALREELAKPTGAELSGFMATVVSEVLRRIAGRADIGLESSNPAGWDGAGDTALYNFKGKDVETLYRGHFGLTKKLFGLRRNASVLSFRAGDEKANGWNTQVTGVSNNLQLAAYGSPDKVGAYGDIVSSIEEPYQVHSSVLSFTENGFYTDNQEILNNAVTGMLVYTDATLKKWNVIQSVDKGTGLITGWDNWASSAGYEIPASTEMVTVDPEGKLWTLNYNLILRNGGRSKNGTIAEMGVLNQSGYTSGVVGIDIVQLPGSTSNSDTGLVIRGANKTGERWLQSASFRHYSGYGIGFYKSGTGLALADAMFNGDAVSAIEFEGNNSVFSQRWRIGGTGLYAQTTCTSYNPQGTVMRQGVLNTVVTTDASMSASIKSYRLNTGTGTASTPKVVTLPDTAGVLAGHEQYLKCYGNAPITFKTYALATVIDVPTSNTTNPPVGNHTSSVTFYPTAGHEYKLDWDGSSWRIWE